MTKLTNMVLIADSALINPWGISYSLMSPFWVSRTTGPGSSTLYSVDPVTHATTKQGLVVTIPGTGNVTGQVFNPGKRFQRGPVLVCERGWGHLRLVRGRWERTPRRCN